jgi:hypothetical protein
MVVCRLGCGHVLMFRARWQPRRGERLWCARCVAEPAVVSSLAAASRRQLVALHASLGGLGVTVRVDRLRIVSELVGRELSSTSDLSWTEARRVITALKRRGCA